MPLLTEYKDALKAAIANFSQKEAKPTPEQTQSIYELTNLIDAMDSGVHLRQEIKLKLRKMPSKKFSFWFFVNDLPKEIKKVLDDPQFSENQLLIAGYGTLYEDNKELHKENKKLRQENELLRKEFNKFKTSDMPEEIAKNFQHLTQENLRLSEELASKDKQHKQELELVTSEKDVLEQSVVSLTLENTSLQTKLEKTENEKQQLSENYLQKVDENMQLKEENKRLKEELEKYKQSKSNDYPKYKP